MAGGGMTDLDEEAPEKALVRNHELDIQWKLAARNQAFVVVDGHTGRLSASGQRSGQYTAHQGTQAEAEA
jgi:hypothetical protein